jgi:hypothetical protein
MPKTLPDIEYSEDKEHPVIDSKNSFYTMPYFKDNDYFMSYDSYVHFIKGCEKLVRNNDRYKKYISYLKGEIKLNKCQVLKDVSDADEVSIEMHHTPFTLFDICAIITEYYLYKNWKITTFRIANQVLDEHQENRIGVVMLSETVHEAVHNGNIIITYPMIYGDLKSFIKKYNNVISNQYREKINKLIDVSLLRDPDDFGILDLNPDLYKKKEE